MSRKRIVTSPADMRRGIAYVRQPPMADHIAGASVLAAIGDFRFLLPGDGFKPLTYPYGRPQDAVRFDVRRVAKDHWDAVRAYNAQVANAGD